MSNRYKRISVYFNLENSQDSLRCSLFESFGNKKKHFFDKMLDQWLSSYGISQIEDLTLGDLQDLKKEILGEENSQKEKRPRGRPRKAVDANKSKELKQDAKSQLEHSEQQVLKMEEEDGSSIDAEVQLEEATSSIVEPVNAKTNIEQPKNPPKAKSPMFVSIEEDEETDDENENDLDPDLVSELSSFFN